MNNIFSALFSAAVVFFHAWPCVTLALESALVEVVIYETSSSGDYTTYTYELEGKFSNAGAATSAEGNILQVIKRLSCVLLSGFRRRICLTPAQAKPVRHIAHCVRRPGCSIAFAEFDFKLHFENCLTGYLVLEPSVLDLFTKRLSKLRMHDIFKCIAPLVVGSL